MATRQGTSTKSSSVGILIVGAQGDAIASAATITISDSIHEVTGSTDIATINGGTSNQMIFLYKGAAATWNLLGSGNISEAVTVTANTMVILVTPDGSNWKPVYQAATGLGSTYLPLAGGTLTGDATISKATPALVLSDTGGGRAYSLLSVSDGSLRAYDGTATTYPLWIEAGSPNYTCYIDASGRLGVLTSNPTSTLTVAGDISLGASGPTITSGSGTPENAVTAPVGSLFVRTDGGAGTSLYVKESGAGDTGWVGK